ncbi:hypothetical protein PENTCL1PPCAC_23689, partial [Pristionchus entomophagus]
EALISLLFLVTLRVRGILGEQHNQVDAVFVVDISNGNRDAFISQLLRARETMRYIAQLPNCTSRFGLVAFHRTAVSIISLDSEVAGNVDKYAEVLLTLRPRQNARANLTVGIKAAHSAFNSSSHDDDRRRIVFLLHDGEAEDNVEGVVDILNEARQSHITVMVIASSQSTHTNSLLGLVDGEKSRLYKKGADRLPFNKTIRKIATAGLRRLTSIHRKRPSLISKLFASNTLSLDKGGNCTREIDLIIVLDTSGSVYHFFEEQRALAEDLVKRLGDPRGLRIGLVRFSARPTVAVALDAPLNKEEVLERVHLTSFTGGATRISLAMEQAMDELRRVGRQGVQQYLVLLSDGHGQETWREASRVGERVTASGIIAYAASTSNDFNLDELALYVAERERIYTRARQPSFVADIVGPINECLQSNGVEPVTKTSPLSRTSTESSRTFPTAPLKTLKATTPFQNEIFVSATPKTMERDDLDEDDFSNDGSGETAPNTKVAQNTRIPSDLVAVAAVEDVQPVQQQLLQTTTRSTTPTTRQVVPSTFILPAHRTQPEAALHIFESTLETSGRSAIGGVRFGVISFAANATIDRQLSLGAGPEVMGTIRGIKHTGGTTSVVSAMRAAMAEASKRRVDSSLLVLLISDGHSKDHWEDITRIAARLHNGQNVQVFALTVSDHFSREELKAWAKHDANIFTSHNQAAWLNRVKTELLSCALGSLEVSTTKCQIQVREINTFVGRY